MKKQLVIVGIIVLLLTVELSGCNENNNTVQSDEEKIIGTWTYSFIYNNNTLNASYIFLSNKTLDVISSYNEKVYTTNGTWSLTDNKLLMNFEGQDTITSDYKFSKDYTKLILTDSSGNIGIFIKQ